YMQVSGRQLQALETIGQSLEQRGHGRWLIAFYEELLEGGEKDPHLLRMLGDSYFTASQYWTGVEAGAGEALERANEFYVRYLDSARLAPAELGDFAGYLRHRRVWLAARSAYEKLLDNRPPSGQTLVHYGSVLLHLGEVVRAEEVFATHYEMRGKDGHEARNIAQQLFTFQRFEAAEPYLLDLFESDNQDFLQQSFALLAEIYRNSDQIERIGPLMERYLERAQNTTRARQTILTILENSGMWPEAIDQIERMQQGGSTSMDWNLAQSYFRNGQDDRAHELFSRFAENSTDQSSAWITVAQFYQSRAMAEPATDAFERAIRYQPDNPLARAFRGRLHLLRGDLEEGLADFDHIFKSVDGPQSHEYRAMLAETLQDIGHFGRARQVARDALVHAPYEREFFLRLIAQEDLDTSDPARIDRAIAELRQQGMALMTLVHLLEAFGHSEWALRVIEDEIEQGDQDQALRVLLDRAELFARHGGLGRLRDAVSPLLDENRADEGRLLAIFGAFLVREGQLEEGVLHLQAAIDQGQRQFLPLLAHTLALLGRHQEAHARFQHHMAQVRGPMLAYELRVVALRYEFLGKSDELIELLRHLARDDRFAHAAAPLWMVYSMEAGDDVFAALDLLRTTSAYQRLMEGAGDEGRIMDQPFALVVANSLEALAARGFVREVNSFIAGLPENAREAESMRDLQVRLAALDLTTGAEVIEAALARQDDTQKGRLARLRLARILTINGHYSEARDIAAPLLAAPDRAVSQQAMEVALSTTMAADQPDLLQADLEVFLANASDKQLARTLAADHLMRMGLDDAQIVLRERNVETMATEANVAAAFNAALAMGDADRVATLSDTVRRVGESPVTFLNSLTESDARFEPELLELTVGSIRKAFPALVDTRMKSARTAFRKGDVEAARAILLAYLQEVDFERGSVEWVFSELMGERLHVEVARFLGPRVPADNLTPNALRYLGLAHLAIGFESEARDFFERFLDRTSDRALAAVELARRLQEDGHYRFALHYAELSVELRPDRPEGYLYRGISRLAAGGVEEARPDIDLAMDQGVGQMLGRFRVAAAALHADEPDFAIDQLRLLTRTPIPEGFQILYPLRLALASFDGPDHAPTGVRFLEEYYPRLSAGMGITRNEVATFNSNLFERAGFDLQAYAIYEGAIHHERVRAPLDPALPTYLNNLAYTYSTTNAHIDEGLDMVRRAIASSDARSASYIDTLGWLYYRAGDLPRAEAEVRRSLRSSGGGNLEIKELYLHLAELLELQGRFEDAIWIRIFLTRIE
ncbi:MAG: tetratricopeptide repeat protein, partial [Bradymonadaceae bacterium]